MATKKTGEFKLNQNQIAFCQYYVSEEFFCNGTKSYMKAYPDASYDAAKNEASVFLTNPYILDYIDKILEDMALNDQRVDKELAKLILQDDEKSIKLWAIKEYNNLKARIEKGLQRAIDKGEVNPDTSLLTKLKMLTDAKDNWQEI